MMKPRSWFVSAVEFGARRSVQKVARSLNHASPVASYRYQSDPG